MSRDYKCPNCQGEFNAWGRGENMLDEVCPFCGVKAGSYPMKWVYFPVTYPTHPEPYTYPTITWTSNNETK